MMVTYFCGGHQYFLEDIIRYILREVNTTDLNGECWVKRLDRHLLDLEAVHFFDRDN